jgi:hypothetical protein
MEPEHFRFGGGIAETTIAPPTVVLVLVASVLILLLPRKYAVLPFLFASLMLPPTQVVVVGGLHFMVFRILVLVGWVRLLESGTPFKPGTTSFNLTSIDRAVLWWSLSSAAVFILLYHDFAAFINRMGFLYNAIGVYFLLRFLIHDSEDADRVLKLLSLTCMLLAALMILELLTGRNMFSVFGAVPEFSELRAGRLRCQGPFHHPILAGTFGATLFPLFLGMRWAKKSKLFSVMGMLAAVVITITSASATPLLALATAIVALLFWPLRKKMRLLRWGLAILLVSLHMVMKAPVWGLIARVNVVGGSSGYHRYELINRAIMHFSEWWLLGAKNTASWGYLMHDTANQYVDIAVTGGLLGLVLYITILVRCFRSIGLARKAAELDGDPKLERRHWAMGAWLVATALAFIGISYFDQTIVMWYLMVAIISGTATASARARHAPPDLAPASSNYAGEGLALETPPS